MRAYVRTGCVLLSLGKFTLPSVRTQEDDAIHVCTRRQAAFLTLDFWLQNREEYSTVCKLFSLGYIVLVNFWILGF